MLKVTIKGVKIVKHYENSKKIDYLSVIFFKTSVLGFFAIHFPAIRFTRCRFYRG